MRFGFRLHDQVKHFDSMARLNGIASDREEVEQQLVRRLWQKDLNWAALHDKNRNHLRQEVLDHLIDEALVAQASAQASFPETDLQHRAKLELAQFRKHFPQRSPYRERLKLQKLSASDITANFEKAQRQTMFLEQIGCNSNFPEATAPQRTLPKRYHLRQIFVAKSTRSSAAKVAQLKRTRSRLLAKSIGFREAAASYSEDRATRARGGDLGWISESRLPKDLVETVACLQPGELSEVVESSMGWHLLELVEMRAPETVLAAPGDPETEAFLQDQHRHQLLETWLRQQRVLADLQSAPHVLAKCQPSHP